MGILTDYVSDKDWLFNVLLLANLFQYMEAGAVPALLLTIAEAFRMDPSFQGLLGGVVYLSLGMGGPAAGYFLRKFNHKVVVSLSLLCNAVLTFFWALTPVDTSYSTILFISLRCAMGLAQCVLCVYLPLWTYENAPKDRKTTWMSYLQASVPLGVMMGYVLATLLMHFFAHEQALSSSLCAGLLCWRWPFLLQLILLAPVYIILGVLVSADHLQIVGISSQRKSAQSRTGSCNEGLQLLPQTPPKHEIASAGTPVQDLYGESENLYRREERRRERRSLRRHSLSASLYDPRCVSDCVTSQSRDDLSSLDTMQVFDLLPWSPAPQSRPSLFQQSAFSAANDADSRVKARSGGRGTGSGSSAGASALSGPAQDTAPRSARDSSGRGKSGRGGLMSYGSTSEGSEAATTKLGAIEEDYSLGLIDGEEDVLKYSSLAASSGTQAAADSDSHSSDSDDDIDYPDAGQPQRVRWPQALQVLGSNPVYVFILLAMTGLYFTVTGIQFWGTAYLSLAFPAVSLYELQLLFVCVSASAPTLGVFLGGVAVDRFFGGYSGHRRRVESLGLCVCLGALSVCCAVPVTLPSSSLATVVLCLWVCLGAGASVLPCVAGLLVHIVPRRLRPFSGALSLCVFNLLGYSAALLGSGLLMSWVSGAAGDVDSRRNALRLGLRLSLCVAGVAQLCLLGAYFCARDQQRVRLEGRRRPAGMRLSFD